MALSLDFLFPKHPPNHYQPSHWKKSTIDKDREEVLENAEEFFAAKAIRISKTALLERIVSSRGDTSDLAYMLANTPWNVGNAHLVVKEWPALMTWEQVDMSQSVIWVHVHGLPLPQLNAKNVERIGSLFEGMEDFEVEAKNVLYNSDVLRVKTKFLMDKPLTTGFTNIISEDWQPWVKFKYESLPECCFFCGRLGHSLSRCWFRGEDEKQIEYDEPEKGFGPWLQASTPPSRMYVRDPPPKTRAELGADDNAVPPTTVPDFGNSQKEFEPGTTSKLSKKKVNKKKQVWVPVQPDNQPPLMATPQTCSKSDSTTRGNSQNHEVGTAILSIPVLDPNTPSSLPPKNCTNLDDSLTCIGEMATITPCRKRKGDADEGPSLKKQRKNLEDDAATEPSMTILVWNCQGIGRPLTVRALNWLVTKHRPSLIFVMECKQTRQRLEKIRRQLRYDQAEYVERVGLSGGLALWWRNDWNVRVLSSNFNYLHLLVTEGTSDS
ncbi:hypothetical protein Tsubulata_007732 [Turnera subulata]|uniref:Zinc knuckle CX2CX4HX4C domain-containing protein n=1 Tax=Turnera subulata TaxID=218843 RepID=A0A9Q0F6R1_9ROSI|nr:hypothetical protein Tsubulata_007732 [Turnera subulata]